MTRPVSCTVTVLLAAPPGFLVPENPIADIIFVENSCEYVAMIIERGMFFQTYYDDVT